MTSCLVTGGGGFLGTHLRAVLNRLGSKVRVLDRSPGPSGPDDWVTGDFTRPEEIDAAVAGCNYVFHLAGTTIPKTSNDDPAADVHANVEGTLALLDAARRHGVEKVIFASSGGTVYGPTRDSPVPEDHPTDPISSYGIAKLAVEKYLHLYRVLHGLDYCVLRLANPYGEFQRVDRAQGAVAVFLSRVLAGVPIEIWGDGSVVRDYVYAGDVADAMAAAAFREAPMRQYNVGSGHGTTLIELIRAIERATGRHAAVEFVPGRPFDVPANVLDISRARTDLHWEPRVSLEEGLQRTLRWLEGR